jgi:steroid delta-isomerase-like uncharacterized protein
MSQTNKTILTAFIERVWSQGDAAAIETYIASQYTIHNDPGDPWEGQTLNRDGFRNRLIQSRAPFPDQVFHIVDMVSEVERVAINWNWNATHLGDLRGFPATGKPITMTGFTLYSFQDNLLTGHWQVCDRLGVFQQLQAS